MRLLPLCRAYDFWTSVWCEDTWLNGRGRCCQLMDYEPDALVDAPMTLCRLPQSAAVLHFAQDDSAVFGSQHCGHRGYAASFLGSEAVKEVTSRYRSAILLDEDRRFG